MFRKAALIASFALATLALATPASAETPFPSGIDPHAKFAWAQANIRAFCLATRTKVAKFEDLPGKYQAGLILATRDQVVAGIMEDCLVPAKTQSARAR